MKTIDLEQLKNLAKLSMLNFSEAELKEMLAQFNGKLQIVSELAGVKVHGEFPHLGAVDASQLREDKPTASLSQELALANAPKQRKGQFNVPKVVD